MEKVFYCFLILFLPSCDSVEKEYYESGMILREYSFNNNGMIEGEMKFYDEDGNLREVFNYQNGIKEGNSKVFFANGKLQAENFYSNDLRNGVSKTYHENGNLNNEIEFSKGKMNGFYNSFYDDGELNMKAFIINDSTTYFKKYSKSGQLIDFYRAIEFKPLVDSVKIGDNFELQISLNGRIEDIEEIGYAVLNLTSFDSISNFKEIRDLRTEFILAVPAITRGAHVVFLEIVENDTVYTKSYNGIIAY
jgi:hypothetical protein